MKILADTGTTAESALELSKDLGHLETFRLLLEYDCAMFAESHKEPWLKLPPCYFRCKPGEEAFALASAFALAERRHRLRNLA